MAKIDKDSLLEALISGLWTRVLSRRLMTRRCRGRVARRFGFTSGRVSIGPGLTMVGSAVRLGEGVYVGKHCKLEGYAVIQVGEGTVMEDRVAVETSWALDTAATEALYMSEAVVIGQRCRIGEGSRVLPGARIPDGTVVPPNSCVGASAWPHE